jgi:hypothetical protein
MHVKDEKTHTELWSENLKTGHHLEHVQLLQERTTGKQHLIKLYASDIIKHTDFTFCNSV